jgi:hypothetical protein
MANHCQRDRRSLSIRPGKLSRLINDTRLPGVTGTEARTHATAKNPERSSASRAICSSMASCALQGGSHRRRVAMELGQVHSVIEVARRDGKRARRAGHDGRSCPSIRTARRSCSCPAKALTQRRSARGALCLEVGPTVTATLAIARIVAPSVSNEQICLTGVGVPRAAR